MSLANRPVFSATILSLLPSITVPLSGSWTLAHCSYFVILAIWCVFVPCLNPNPTNSVAIYASTGVSSLLLDLSGQGDCSIKLLFLSFSLFLGSSNSSLRSCNSCAPVGQTVEQYHILSNTACTYVLTNPVCKSMYLTFAFVALYPMSVPVKLCLPKNYLCLSLLLTQMLAPNTLSCHRLGRIPYHTLYGMMCVLECTLRLCRNTACTSAADQYSTDSPAQYSKAPTATVNVPF